MTFKNWMIFSIINESYIQKWKLTAKQWAKKLYSLRAERKEMLHQFTSLLSHHLSFPCTSSTTHKLRLIALKILLPLLCADTTEVPPLSTRPVVLKSIIWELLRRVYSWPLLKLAWLDPLIEKSCSLCLNELSRWFQCSFRHSPSYAHSLSAAVTKNSTRCAQIIEHSVGQVISAGELVPCETSL